MDKCENCKYYAELKVFSRTPCTLSKNSNVVSGFSVETNINRYDVSHCCLWFLKAKENIVYETTPNDMCECFKEKEKANE